MTGVAHEKMCHLWDVPRFKDMDHGGPGVEVAFENMERFRIYLEFD